MADVTLIVGIRHPHGILNPQVLILEARRLEKVSIVHAHVLTLRLQYLTFVDEDGDRPPFARRSNPEHTLYAVQ